MLQSCSTLVAFENDNQKNGFINIRSCGFHSASYIKFNVNVYFEYKSIISVQIEKTSNCNDLTQQAKKCSRYFYGK